MPRLASAPTRSPGHDGVFIPPRPGGGDDGGGEDKPDRTPNYGLRLRHARLGLAVAMAPIVTLFLTFSVVYLVRRGYVSLDPLQKAYVREWTPLQLPWLLLFINTAILIASSGAIEFARRAITREAALAPVRSIPGISLGREPRFPWLTLTTFLGFLFLAGQLEVWRNFSARGFHMTGGTSSPFVYVLTAMHGVHLAGGVIALVSANVAALLNRSINGRRIVVDIASWYWHCMTLIWLYILVMFSIAAK